MASRTKRKPITTGEINEGVKRYAKEKGITIKEAEQRLIATGIGRLDTLARHAEKMGTKSAKPKKAAKKATKKVVKAATKVATKKAAKKATEVPKKTAKKATKKVAKKTKPKAKPVEHEPKQAEDELFDATDEGEGFEGDDIFDEEDGDVADII